MKRAVILAILAAGLIVADSVYTTAIQPELKSQLTLEQFENPSLATDTALRGMSNVPLRALAWGGLALIAVGMYLPEIKKGLGITKEEV